jgi:SulP family sulfate permease
MATPISGSARSSSFLKYNVAGTMDRVRSNMVGGRKYSIDEAEEPYTWNYNTTTDSQEEDETTQSKAYQNKGRVWRGLSKAASQVPAIVLIALFHLMIGIPFGVSYFPIGWRNDMGSSDEDTVEAEDGVKGPFPLPGKEALGIRMFLFSTVVGQVVFTLKSKFHNPIGLQMVENVPFCHALSHIVVSRQGYGRESLSTLMVMFGLASVIVGVVFLLLGKFRLGRLVYYFPTHVLVGCIGGIGLYIGKTGIEVTMNAPMTLSSMSSSRNLPLLGVVILFEVILRCLERLTKRTDGTPKYALLSPIYFCSITPVFYMALLLFRVDLDHVMEAGYFFPSLQDDNASNGGSIIWNEHLLDMWRIIDFSVVSWGAIMDSIPTLVALVLFSLIHVPINIPAFALSTNTEAEMNTELVAHGYSNMIAGCLGGLQNYMAYTQSVLYGEALIIAAMVCVMYNIRNVLLYMQKSNIAADSSF